MRTSFLAASALAVLLAAQSPATGRVYRSNGTEDRIRPSMAVPVRAQLATVRGDYAMSGYDDWAAYTPVMPMYGFAAYPWPAQCCSPPACPPRRERCCECGHRKGGLLCRMCCGRGCRKDECCAPRCDDCPCEDRGCDACSKCLDDPCARRQHRRAVRQARHRHRPGCGCAICAGPAIYQPAAVYAPRAYEQELLAPPLLELEEEVDGPVLEPSAAYRRTRQAALAAREKSK